MIYPNINKLKSAEMVASAWATIFKETCLEPAETITEKPGGFFNTFLALTTQHAATAFYEQRMLINEVNPSTSILKRSLMSGLSNSEISSIYARPSTATFAICLNKDQVIKAIDKLSSSYSPTDRYLIINKDMSFDIDGYPNFVLPRNIKVMYKTVQYIDSDGRNKTRNNVYALYDDKDPVGKTVNPTNSYIVTTREINSDGKVYVLLYVKCVQESRTYIEHIVTDEDNIDFRASYTDGLVGFELFVEESTGNLTPITAFTEGTSLTSSYQCNYTLSTKNGSKTIEILFDKSPRSYKPKVSQKLHLVVYETSGENGNIEFPKLATESLSSLTCNYAQNVTDKRQTPINSIETLVFTKDVRSTGGKDDMTFSQLRRYVVSKNRSNDTITTIPQLEDLASEYNLEIKKIRHDIIAQNYRTFSNLYDGNYIVSSTSTPFRFKYKTDENYPFDNRKHTLITPKHYFTENPELGYYYFDLDKNNQSIVDYIKEKRTNITDFKHQAFFPFLLHINATEYIKVNVIDPNVDSENIDINCTMVNDNSQDSIDVSGFTIFRNYCSEKSSWKEETDTHLRYFTEAYKMYFIATFGNPITNVDNISFKIKMTSESNHNVFISENPTIEIIPGTGNYKALVCFDIHVNDNDIEYDLDRFSLNYDKVVKFDESIGEYTVTNGSSWRPYPVSTNLIPNTRYCDFELSFEIVSYIKCKSESYNEYSLDNSSEKSIYDGSWLTAEEKGETGSGYRLYAVSAYSSGKVEIMKNLTKNMSMDVKIDADNVTKIVDGEKQSSSEYVCTIYDVLAIDKGYSTTANYDNVLRSLDTYSSSLENIKNRLIDGFKVFMGLKKTIGKSNKFKIRDVNGLETPLNSLSISLSFDIKISDETSSYDPEYVRSVIINTIVDYINENNDPFISFDSIYDKIKGAVPNIAFITIKEFNGYDVGDYQTIVNDVYNVEESISVRMIPPANISDENIENVEFEPAITINFII